MFSSKRKVKKDVPIRVGCAVYDQAKLRLLEFYYDCIDKYIDNSNYMVNCVQQKNGLTYSYTKIVVWSNGIDTLPLPI